MPPTGPKDRLDLARSADATPEQLALLSASPYPFVVEAVAGHASTPPDVLSRLVPEAAESWHAQTVLRALAENPSFPAEHLPALAERLAGLLDNGRPNHQAFAAGLALVARPDAPLDCIVALLRDTRTAVQFRKVVAARVGRPELAPILAADPSETVRRAWHRRAEGSVDQ